MTKFTTALLVASLLSSCCHSKKAATNDTVSQVKSENQIYRLSLSFYSIGTGTDAKSRQKMLDYVTAFEQKAGKKLAFEKVAWGREGETDYCFLLKELSVKQQEEFISKMKQEMKDAVHLHINENTVCRN